MKHKNMKIEINNEQPLDEVVRELERLGYKKEGWIGYAKTKFITSNARGFFTDHVISFLDCFYHIELTTLQQLREMK